MSNQTVNRIEQAYESLLEAEKTHQAISPLTELVPDLSVEEAYHVQLKIIEKKVNDGQKIVGKKIGLTSLAMQQLLGVDQPDYGHLFKYMDVTGKEMIAMKELFAPKIEGEIAFVLKKDLQGPSVTIEDVLDATDYVVPALEIVDSRIKDWKIKLPDTIADNASCGLYLLGQERISINDIDLPKVEMSLYKNGELINQGTGKDVLENPAACVAWLANKLHEYGVTLKANEVILSGALSAAVNAEAGDRFTAEFKNFGKVEAVFS
ncbi:2-keto-4-pentenoate hydratase [Alkalihalobacillus sp. BA299]|uniref:2-keto-4-pentenoate hydratase n=1 Tax=Alkalihalobacillus sp. BA299 TaxID=2815938 RepID=UPI001ADD5B8C|nr:fumarylacetoacetate hydrolase family protein [Alkalihalobacillus sp. BA299]